MTDGQPPAPLLPLRCEYPARGIILERSADSTLYIFVVQDSKPETLDAWKNCTKTVLSKWPLARPCLFLHDLRRTSLSAFNADMQGKFEELYRFRPQLERLVAVVLPTYWGVDRIAQLDLRLRSLTAPYGYAIYWEVFTGRRDALRWLTQMYLNRFVAFV